MFDPTSIMLGEALGADCVVATQAGLSNARADITLLGPDGSAIASMTDVPFSPSRGQQEARLSRNFPSFTADDVGEYTCLATITSDSFPGASTRVSTTMQIPGAGDLYHCSNITPYCEYAINISSVTHYHC